MKSQFISALADGQIVTSLFLVREKEIRTSPRTGKSWLELSLADRTGTIAAKMWDNFAALAPTFERDDVIQIRGRVKLYNGQKELTLEQIIPAAERDYDLGDFLPHTKYDVEKLYGDLRAAISGMKNPWLKQLLSSVVDDPAIAPRLKRAPAAMTMHHAYLGGLLEHVVSLIGLAAAVSAHYPELDADLLLSGVVLHDVGKIDELRYARGIDYSDAGRLLGHITIGVGIVRDKCKAIADFPAPLAVLVEHLILSHHGSYEFGSPSLPQIPEAVALNFIDDIDSKMAGMRATLESGSGATASLWTDRNPSLRRALLRANKYLAGEGSANGASAQERGAARAASAPAAKDPARKG
ncbi:MAG: OB-fold nucleic acid binding domain-containing protein [Candidatus Acidiferrales bacterium]|jgi:3'-5' exoribonuclease